ncbi:MAG: GNAT family N-acetyltransferase [Candidatus Diapherotrites archaeon]|nr:GNAT family N-acetyltransferase [Candidatus Diapherotrites archaeon]
MEIRKASPSDAENICSLILEASRDLNSRGLVQWPPDYPPVEKIIEIVGHGEQFVAVEGRKIVGCFSVTTHLPKEFSKVKWAIEDSNPRGIRLLAVYPKYQGKRVGSKIMKRAEKEAASQGAKSLRLATHESNIPANKFYASLGYKKVGEIEVQDWPIKGKFYCYEKAVFV